jgi:hypothetical protein
VKFFLKKENLPDSIAQLFAGLSNLSFKDNFTGWEWEGEIAASTEVRIRNELRDGTMPNRFVITDALGVNSIVRGDDAWNVNFITLKNTDGAIDATVKVFFYREGR